LAPSTQRAEALGSLNVRTSIFCLSELRAPWGFRVGGAPMPKFHLVVSGTAWLTLEGRDPQLLCSGDLVVLPNGHTHTMSDEPGAPVTELDQLIAVHPLESGLRLRCGGPGPETRLLCGGFVLADQAALLAALPDVLRVDGELVGATAWLEPMLTILEDEVRQGDLGSTAIQAKVADVFVAQALRSWLIAADRDGVLPAAVLSEDGPIAEAISIVRGRLAARWTVDELASNVALSRTAFISRFRQSVGESPMRYVARLRLSTAAGLLSTTRLSLEEIAFQTGYQNGSSFSKAFRREFGYPPGSFRATLRNTSAVTRLSR
jgi:AraC-like DNA-binding protein